MNLKVYLAAKGITCKAFAEKVGCHYGYMSRISVGAVMPGKWLAKRIREATGGQVNFDKALCKRCSKLKLSQCEGKDPPADAEGPERE